MKESLDLLSVSVMKKLLWKCGAAIILPKQLYQLLLNINWLQLQHGIMIWFSCLILSYEKRRQIHNQTFPEYPSLLFILVRRHFGSSSNFLLLPCGISGFRLTWCQESERSFLPATVRRLKAQSSDRLALLQYLWQDTSGKTGISCFQIHKIHLHRIIKFPQLLCCLWEEKLLVCCAVVRNRFNTAPPESEDQQPGEVLFTALLWEASLRRLEAKVCSERRVFSRLKKVELLRFDRRVCITQFYIFQY